MATLTFAYLLGPAMLYATAQTIAGGRQVGCFSALADNAGAGHARPTGAHR
ncbi:MAG: hypothetical protein AAF141_07865 [Pseudomonadota bacterium]